MVRDPVTHTRTGMLAWFCPCCFASYALGNTFVFLYLCTSVLVCCKKLTGCDRPTNMRHVHGRRSVRCFGCRGLIPPRSALHTRDMRLSLSQACHLRVRIHRPRERHAINILYLSRTGYVPVLTASIADDEILHYWLVSTLSAPQPVSVHSEKTSIGRTPNAKTSKYELWA